MNKSLTYQEITANLEGSSISLSNHRVSHGSSSTVVRQPLSKDQAKDALKKLIRVHSNLYKKAQHLVQVVIAASQRSQSSFSRRSEIQDNEAALTSIEGLMNRCSDELVMPNSCSTSTKIGKFCDLLSEVQAQIQGVQANLSNQHGIEVPGELSSSDKETVKTLTRVIEKAWRGCAPAQINVPRDFWTQVIDIELPQIVRLERPSGGPEAIAGAAQRRSGGKLPVHHAGAGGALGGRAIGGTAGKKARNGTTGRGRKSTNREPTGSGGKTPNKAKQNSSDDQCQTVNR